MLTGPVAETITNLGNIVVAGPLVVLMVAWLWWTGSHRLAVVIGGSTFGALAVAVVLRHFSRLSGGELTDTPFRLTIGAPSGHAVTSTIIYGALGVLFCLGSRGVVRFLAVGLTVLTVVGVGVTRVTLHTHSPGDVAAGLLLGGLFAIPVALVARREALPSMMPLLPCAVLAVILMELSGLRFVSTGLL